MRLFFCLILLLTVGITQAAPKPNVVVILTDDQGWGDLSVSGNTNLATPHVDSLARDGVTLENFYVCQVCSPTRAEFLTGRYHPRTGVSGVSNGQERLNPDETTIADLLKANGYATGAFGKWHNGTQSPYHPNDRGFDEYYGFTSGHWGHYFSPPLDHNGSKVRGKGYIVDDFTDHAMAFIEENRDRPFFCYIPYNTPHSPMMVDDDFYAKFKDVDPEMRNRDSEKEDLPTTRAALAMCEDIDWNVGRVLKKLDDLELTNDTIVIYFSDNGPNSYRWNGDMKGKKGSIDEGGLRSPFFIRWPGKIDSGKKIEVVTSVIDLLPTIANLTGIKPKTAKPIDGINLEPLLRGGEVSGIADRMIFSIRKKSVSVRNSKFRLDGGGKLFNIENDRGQHTDISKKHPAVAAQLKSAAAAHMAEMKTYFSKNQDRPFTVGYSESTTLPARDGIPHGTIQRSSKAPNNSFFKNWTSESDSITWDVEVGAAGNYEAIVHYTCAKVNVGAIIRLSAADGDSTEANVTEVFDPPLYDKSKERVTESHYFVKDFKPLALGTITLSKGTTTLSLTAPKIIGTEAIDVHSIELNRLPTE